MTACLINRKWDWSPRTCLVNYASLVPIELVQHLLLNDYFDLASVNQIFEYANDGLFPIVPCEI
ncbi:hypothetical protein A9Z05_07950 [Burkholderia sp. A2]|nr:hypothetical protein A9Z05_07950 [Burkholderia sp. A2]